MGLFGNIKDFNDKQQEKAQAMRDKLPVRLKAQYYGGYDKYTKKAEGTLNIYNDRVEFITVGFKSFKFTIDKPNIKELAVEGQDQAGKRITATRLLTTGILAFAWQKKTSQNDTFITVVTSDGQEAIFHIKGKSHMELKPVIAQKIDITTTSSPSNAAQATDNVTEQLTQLSKLKEQGILTEAEFTAKKKQLLGL
jgi:hypothetical protein